MITVFLKIEQKTVFRNYLPTFKADGSDACAKGQTRSSDFKHRIWGCFTISYWKSKFEFAGNLERIRQTQVKGEV